MVLEWGGALCPHMLLYVTLLHVLTTSSSRCLLSPQIYMPQLDAGDTSRYHAASGTLCRWLLAVEAVQYAQQQLMQAEEWDWPDRALLRLLAGGGEGGGVGGDIRTCVDEVEV